MVASSSAGKNRKGRESTKTKNENAAPEHHCEACFRALGEKETPKNSKNSVTTRRKGK